MTEEERKIYYDLVWKVQICTLCGKYIGAYSSKFVNVKTKEVRCEEGNHGYPENTNQKPEWYRYSDG